MKTHTWLTRLFGVAAGAALLSSSGCGVYQPINSVTPGIPARLEFRSATTLQETDSAGRPTQELRNVRAIDGTVVLVTEDSIIVRPDTYLVGSSKAAVAASEARRVAVARDMNAVRVQQLADAEASAAETGGGIATLVGALVLFALVVATRSWK